MLKLILLGSGNAATQLGTALFRAGYQFIQIYSRKMDHAARLAERIGGADYTDDPSEIKADQADLIISALRDSVAEDVWRQIHFGTTPVCHTAGSMPLDSLAPYAQHRGVLYPLQTLSLKRDLDFSSIPLFIEAESAGTLKKLKRVATAISKRVRVVTSEQRKSIHIAAVFANNFSNHMFSIASELLREKGLDFDDLLPLIDETSSKVHDLEPAAAQTGPAIRYDENIITEHKRCLADHPEWAELYEMISRSIHSFAGKKD